MDQLCCGGVPSWAGTDWPTEYEVLGSWVDNSVRSTEVACGVSKRAMGRRLSATKYSTKYEVRCSIVTLQGHAVQNKHQRLPRLAARDKQVPNYLFRGLGIRPTS
jgi:hypothetical protein